MLVGSLTEEGLEVAVVAGDLVRCDEGDAGPARDRSLPQLPGEPVDTVDNVKIHSGRVLSCRALTSQSQYVNRRAGR